MRVTFYFGVLARIGGIEEFTKDLCLELLRADLEVEVVCAALHHPILDDMEQAGARIVRVSVYYGCRWNIPDLALLPIALLRMRMADVVIHQKPFNFWFYSLFSRKVRHVFITAYRPKEQFPERAWRKRFYSFFDMIFTQTQEFSKDLVDVGVDKHCIKVLPYIPPEVVPAKEEEMPEGVIRVGMMGRLEPQKNPFYALEIVNQLNQLPFADDAQVLLNIYGGGTLEESLRKESARLEFDVEFRGAYTRSDVSGIVDANDMFLISSVSEGQCIVALEILSGGRPLFATPVGALPVILSAPERGAVIPLNDALAAANCISEWWETNRHDPEVIQLSYLEQYDRHSIGQAYVTKLRELAQMT